MRRHESSRKPCVRVPYNLLYHALYLLSAKYEEKHNETKSMHPEPTAPPPPSHARPRFIVRRRDYRLSLQPPPSSESGSRQRATPNPRDQNSSSLSLPSAAAARRLGGGGGVNPSLVHPPDPNVGGGGGGSGGGGVGFRSAGPPPCSSSSAIAREITLDMSPCVPVHARCGFVIERSGVRGVGERGGVA